MDADDFPYNPNLDIDELTTSIEPLFAPFVNSVESVRGEVREFQKTMNFQLMETQAKTASDQVKQEQINRNIIERIEHFDTQIHRELRLLNVQIQELAVEVNKIGCRTHIIEKDLESVRDNYVAANNRIDKIHTRIDTLRKHFINATGLVIAIELGLIVVVNYLVKHV